MERTMQREPVTHGSHVIGSVRGTSSHQYNPMMILTDEIRRINMEIVMQCLSYIVEILKVRH